MRKGTSIHGKFCYGWIYWGSSDLVGNNLNKNTLDYSTFVDFVAVHVLRASCGHFE